MKGFKLVTIPDEDWILEFIKLNDENNHRNLSIIYDNYDQVIIWADFKFKDINQLVIPFLENSLSGIEKIGFILKKI